MSGRRFTWGWMWKVAPKLDDRLVQHFIILCRPRNPSSNKCEPTVEVTYGKNILCFIILPIDILPHLFKRHRHFDMRAIYCSCGIVEVGSVLVVS